MPHVGWSSKDLRVLDGNQNGEYWTISEAARMLGPPTLSETQLRQLIRMVSLEPAGKQPGNSRYVRVYKAVELIKLYEAIAGVIGD
jgi:hypothetical protein